MLKEKIKEKELVNKLDSSEFIHNSDLDKKINNTSRKRRIKSKGKKIVKLQASGLSYFRSKSHFEDNDMQSYLVFQPGLRYLKDVQSYFCLENRCIA